MLHQAAKEHPDPPAPKDLRDCKARKGYREFKDQLAQKEQEQICRQHPAPDTFTQTDKEITFGRRRHRRSLERNQESSLAQNSATGAVGLAVNPINVPLVDAQNTFSGALNDFCGKAMIDFQEGEEKNS